MEWTVDKFGAKVATYGSLKASVWSSSIGWHYSVEVWSVVCSYGTTDTEERAKRFAIYEAHRISRDLVNDLAEITGENYHLELN